MEFARTASSTLGIRDRSVYFISKIKDQVPKYHFAKIMKENCHAIEDHGSIQRIPKTENRWSPYIPSTF
jgi:hypothetical protein